MTSSTHSQSARLSDFTPLKGGHSLAIAPGDRLVTLRDSAATWWESGNPVTVELPNIPVDGAQWSADGKQLYVGPGAIDISAREWIPVASLTHWNEPGPRGDEPVKAVAWFEDQIHVALLLENRQYRVEQETATKVVITGERITEIVVITVATGRARGRCAIESASSIVTSGDRLMVAGQKVFILDLDANIVAEPPHMPQFVDRVRAGAGKFAALGVAGPIVFINPSDGALVGTWDLTAVDAIPTLNGAVAVDISGIVYLGCQQNTTIQTVAQKSAGVGAPIIRIVDGLVVVAGSEAEPVRVAKLGDTCH